MASRPRLLQAKLDTLGPRKARHLFTHETSKSDQFVNYRTTSWEHAPWRPEAGGLTAEAWSGPAWPAPRRRADDSSGAPPAH